VVDSVGFNDSTWLDPIGHPHTEDLHIVERIRRVDPETLVFNFTFDDPKAYAKPWDGQLAFKLKTDGIMTETIYTISDETEVSTALPERNTYYSNTAESLTPGDRPIT